MKRSLLNSTRQRLKEYFPFSKNTLDVVSAFADKQQAFSTYRHFFASVAMPEPMLHVAKNGQGVTVIDIYPDNATKTLVVHLPMGNPLDTNQQYQLATLAGVFPEARIIGFGNPSGGLYSFKEQDLPFWRRLGVATGLNTKALVAAELDYLATHAVGDTYQVGFSYGALKALLVSRYAPVGTVKGVVTIELVSHPRNPIRLFREFNSTLAPLGAYVDAANLPTFREARRDAVNGNDYRIGLRRHINLTIGYLLSRINALKLAEEVLSMQTAAQLTMAWGTASELVDDSRMRRALEAFETQFPGRSKGISLPGQKHGLANDVHLHAAIVYEACSKP